MAWNIPSLQFQNISMCNGHFLFCLEHLLCFYCLHNLFCLLQALCKSSEMLFLFYFRLATVGQTWKSDQYVICYFISKEEVRVTLWRRVDMIWYILDVKNEMLSKRIRNSCERLIPYVPKCVKCSIVWMKINFLNFIFNFFFEKTGFKYCVKNQLICPVKLKIMFCNGLLFIFNTTCFVRDVSDPTFVIYTVHRVL